MKIETLWLTDAEASIAITSMLNANMGNDTVEFLDVGNIEDVEIIFDKINSIDDGYFGEADIKTYSELYQSFLEEGYDKYYAFFIKSYFCGLIKIKKEV